MKTQLLGGIDRERRFAVVLSTDDEIKDALRNFASSLNSTGHVHGLGAVRRATLSMFQDGAAGEDDGNFLADLSPSPAYDELARMQGCFAERVERPSELAGALVRARDAVMKERRQALLNVVCPY